MYNQNTIIINNNQPSTSSSKNYQNDEDDDTNELPNRLSIVDTQTANFWRLNYHEAAIYIEEGINNDKFENHPQRPTKKDIHDDDSSSDDEDEDEDENETQSNHIKHQLLQQQQPSTSSAIEHELSLTFKSFHASTTSTLSAETVVNITQANGSQPTPSPSANKTKAQNKNKHSSSTLFKPLNLVGQYATIETYILVHNRYFYLLDLLASIVLLCLAFVEPPAVNGFLLPPVIHSTIEILALSIIAVELLLKFRWMRPKRFFGHARTMMKLLGLITMIIEAIIILNSKSTHSRYSRAFRPIFLVDNHYCYGIRRIIRQIFQSLMPIIDIFTLSMFSLFVFSIIGYYLFSSVGPYFVSLPSSLGNLLILSTTANLPDIMMPSYAKNRFATIFFIIFVIVHLFIITNLMLASVYEKFTRKEKNKFHKLLIHRRHACQKAFQLLVSRRQPKLIQYKQFVGLMRYLNNKCSMFDTYLIFRALDTKKLGFISLDDFYQVYDFVQIKWQLVSPQVEWYEDWSRCCDNDFINGNCGIDNCGNIRTCCNLILSNIFKVIRVILKSIKKIVEHKYFEWFINLVILSMAIVEFFIALSDSPINHKDRISTLAYAGLFTIEVFARILSNGLPDYLSSSRWNKFDLLVLISSYCGLISGYLGYFPFGWIIVLRVLRLMKVFMNKQRFKDLFDTMTYIIVKRLMCMLSVVLILYYFFAIIGMELLSQYDLRNCCKDTPLESQFKFTGNSTSPDSDSSAKYYLNDFSDIIASYLTLFSMSSNTFWLAIMDAYSISTKSNLIRVYFGVFYLCSMIVFNIIIALILESFLFRINHRNKMDKSGDEDSEYFTSQVELSWTEAKSILARFGNYKDKNYNQLARLVERIERKTRRQEHISNKRLQVSFASKELSHDNVNETTGLLTGKNNDRKLSDTFLYDCELEKNSCATTSLDSTPFDNIQFMYRAQHQNRFAFTMKMYKDDVIEWLADEERKKPRNSLASDDPNGIRSKRSASVVGRWLHAPTASSLRNVAGTSGGNGMTSR